MAATAMQFDYQAEQLLINKMVIMLNEEDAHDGLPASTPPRSSSPSSLKGSLRSLRSIGGQKSPKSGQRSPNHKQGGPRSPELGDGRTTPASTIGGQATPKNGRQQSLLVRKGSAGSAEAAPMRLQQQQDATAEDVKKNKAYKASGMAGFLGLLTKNKKNKEQQFVRRHTSPAPGQRLPPLQRPVGKQDAKLEVRRALAMEAERLRAQQAGLVQQSAAQVDFAHHPRFGGTQQRTRSPSPASASLSPEQRRAQMAVQAEQTQSLLESMHGQQVQLAARSPPQSPPPVSPTARSPPTPTSASPTARIPSSPTSASPPARVPSSPTSTVPSERTLPTATSVSPAPRSPQSPPPVSPTVGMPSSASATARIPPSPIPASPSQTPASPALSQVSQLDGSPRQPRRRLPAASPPDGPEQVDSPVKAQESPQQRQQGRRAQASQGQRPPTATPPSPQQPPPQPPGERDQGSRRGLLSFFKSSKKSKAAASVPPPSKNQSQKGGAAVRDDGRQDHQQQLEAAQQQQRAQQQAQQLALKEAQQKARLKAQQQAQEQAQLLIQKLAQQQALQKERFQAQQEVQRQERQQQALLLAEKQHALQQAQEQARTQQRQLQERTLQQAQEEARTRQLQERTLHQAQEQARTQQRQLQERNLHQAQEEAKQQQALEQAKKEAEEQARIQRARTPPARRQVQQVQQLRPEVQRTEQLLHAERTDQKPPLPRKDRRGAAEAASSSSQKADALQADGKTYCQSCKKKCSGEVLRVQDKYFHIACFKCKVCRNSLAQGGFFCKDSSYYCTADYQRQFGTKCAVCSEYVEGEVVSALGNTYHQKCFTCGRCRQAFPSGERVTYTGKEVLCARCVHIPVRADRSDRSLAASPSSENGPGGPGGNECAGCHLELKECQALIALDRQWHIWCFKCNACGAVLHGEYMGKDGVPYCEKDYQGKFGVKCAYCNRYISGKVLQAGDNHHFHPTCARCTKCGDPFGDGEEMYLQGGAIWHPRCGPGPTENGAVINGVENGHCTDTETEAESGRDTAFDRMSSSAVSDLQFSIRSRTPSLNGSFNSLSRKYQYQRTGSPGLILREYKQHQYPEDISRIYTYSYLTEEVTKGYLKRPIDPYDKPPTSPHFHRPSSAASGRGSKLAHLSKHGSRSGMTVLVDSIRSETPRSRSPHMNNEEPIELAHFPAAKPPQPGEAPKIEREDFPAPPYPYTDPERRRRWSDTYKGVPISDDEDEIDGKSEKETEDEKLKREEKELSKIATGIGKVFLHNVREREKLRQWKMSHMDPRNASRTPSASREPTYRLRYQSPVNASPSRNVDHPRPWEEDELLDRSSSYRSSVGRSVGAIPSYNVVSALRHVPKPGYGLAPRSHTFSSTGGSVSGIAGDYSFSGLGEKTHSTEFSSGKSDISAGSISEVDRRPLHVELPVSTTYTGGLGALRSASYSPHLRRSLPNMTHSNSSEPPKIYPYHLLVITNYRLPADVDRCNLERHLADREFEFLFGCNRAEFYQLPQWKRNELKRRVQLF